MSVLTRDNLQHHCRTCLTKLTQVYDENEKYHVRAENLADWIYNFTSINVREEESHEYPKLVCYQCYDIFKDLDSFQQLVWRTEKTLAGLLGNCENVKSSNALKKFGLKRKIVHKQYQAIFKKVIISDEKETNSNEAVAGEPEAVETENICKLKSVDSKINHSNLKHLAPVTDNDELIIKTKVSDDDLNEDDNKCNSTAETGNNQNELNESECTISNKNNEMVAKTAAPIVIEAADNSEKAVGKVLINERSTVDFNDASKEESSNRFADFDITELENLIDDSTDDLTEYSCEKCNLYYDNKYNCLAHKQLTHEGRRRVNGYKCEICRERYLQFPYLDRHMREIHKIFVRPYKCGYTKCSVRFQNWATRMRHYHEYHQQIKAERITDSLEVLKYEKKLFICIVCNKQYKSLNYIKLHMRIHGDDLKFFCGICGVQHATQKKLNSHYDKSHDSK